MSLYESFEDHWQLWECEVFCFEKNELSLHSNLIQNQDAWQLDHLYLSFSYYFAGFLSSMPEEKINKNHSDSVLDSNVVTIQRLSEVLQRRDWICMMQSEDRMREISLYKIYYFIEI